jgi:hypothetical protein
MLDNYICHCFFYQSNLSTFPHDEKRFRGSQKEDDCGPLSIQSSLGYPHVSRECVNAYINRPRKNLVNFFLIFCIHK